MPAKRTSNRARKLKETFRPSQPTAESPQALGELWRPPRHLPLRQRWIWTQTLGDMPSGLVKRFDRNVLIAFVSAVDRVREANRRLPTLRDPAELQACRRELNEATRLVVMTGREIGASPAARSRITIEAAPEKKVEDDPWEALRLVPKVVG